jgi:hypothetical protein
VGIKINYIREYEGTGDKMKVRGDKEKLIQGYCVLVRK